MIATIVERMPNLEEAFDSDSDWFAQRNSDDRDTAKLESEIGCIETHQVPFQHHSTSMERSHSHDHTCNLCKVK